MSSETHCVNGNSQTTYKPVEVVVWEPVPDKPGYIRVKEARKIADVFREVAAQLPEGMIDEYFNVSSAIRHGGNPLWPYPYRRIVVFPVTGGSEGHYIHVEVFQETSDPGDHYGHRSTCVMLGKTFQGMDHAWKIAQAIGQILDI